MADGKHLNVDINRKRVVKHSGGAGGLFILGFIGAEVYFLQHADSFGQVIIAFLKGCVWPAFLVHDLLKFIYS